MKLIRKFRVFFLLKLISIIKIFTKNKNLKNKLNFYSYNLNKERFKNRNVFIGDNTIIYNTEFSYSQKGDYFYIGNNCTITGAYLLGHDASPTLFIDEFIIHKDVWKDGSRRSYREPIRIGNNVFIGVNAIILPGVCIGDNIIVAAGSIVSTDLDSNFVYAGNPAKKIKPIDEYVEKYKKIYHSTPDKF